MRAQLIEHDTFPEDCRYEVIYRLSSNEVVWRFFATREQAEAFMETVR